MARSHLRLDLLDRRAHADGIDRAVGGDRADHHRHVVFAALAVGDVGEEERLALRLGHAADEFPAHQRMKLRILVDLLGDGDEKALRLERVEMVVEIGIIARRRTHSVAPQLQSMLKMRAAVSPRIARRSATVSGVSSTTFTGSGSPIGNGKSEPRQTLSVPATSQR